MSEHRPSAPDASGPGEAGVLGAELPEGTRFIGPEPGAIPGWRGADFPADADLAACVACGLCLPHCPTYRVTGEESASPRGRIAAMRAVAEGRAEVDETFSTFMDLCLACRACEDVCPSHVPFGRMMERARVEIEPLRSRRHRLLRWLGLEVVLPRRRLTGLAAALAPLARPLLPRHVRRLIPGRASFGRLPEVSEPQGVHRGTVALLAGCVQDRWYREVNLATIRVLVRNGWRVTVPRNQTCCGALLAHHGRLEAARRLARRNLRAFGEADWIVVNAAGCGAHAREYGELLSDAPGEGANRAVGEPLEAEVLSAKTRDLMEFLDERGFEPPGGGAGLARVAYHDACHALRAQGIRTQPRAVLSSIPDLEVLEVPDGDRCCGAAGLYNVLQPAIAGELSRQKAEAVASTGAEAVASANPGCSMQLTSGLRSLGQAIPVLHPIELLDRAYRAEPTEARTP